MGLSATGTDSACYKRGQVGEQVTNIDSLGETGSIPELSADTATWTVMNCKAFTTPIAAAAVFLFSSAVACKAADDFYAGKTVTVAVGPSVGGGIDYYGRILARHLGKHIPGRPSV